MCPTGSKLKKLTAYDFNLMLNYSMNVTGFPTLSDVFLPPSAEYGHEGLSEVPHKPVNGKVEGGVDHLQQLYTGHRIQIPYWSDALTETLNADVIVTKTIQP